jgi:tripartite ATP-independent transporter DctM subunit
MSNTLIGICGVVGLVFLLGLGAPLATAFLVIGFVGAVAILPVTTGISLMGETLYTTIANPTFSVLPLFVLMGAFAARGGFAKQAFDAIYVVAARVPASLAIATSFGNAFFATICGSSLAASVVFGRIAYPAMAERNYDRRFAAGSIASCGTFACMIPPSGMFILFALFTGQSVAVLFMAGIIPGLLTASGYALSMVLRAKWNPALAPIHPAEYEVTVKDRASASLKLGPIILLGGSVIVGMYTGFLTPTEAGAAGAFGTLLFGLTNGALKQKGAIKSSIREAAATTTMLVFIIVTAMFFSRFLALTGIPMEISKFLRAWDVHPNVILLCIITLWFLLGMFMAQAAVFALTLPILFPVVVSLGVDPIWFCIIAMKLNEIAGVSPPVGLNVFGLAGALSGENVKVPVEDIYRGCWPFIMCDLVVLLFLFLVPQIVTFLPNLMMGK